ncbi:MAG TPA: hypothetical protein VGC96_12130 [Candidatus Elarobacter sp.]
MATAIFSCALLAACGGGGGGSSPVTGPTPTPPGGAAPRAVVRSDAQTGLTVAKLLGADNYFPGGQPLGAMSIARRLLGRKRIEAVNCSPGGTSGIGSFSFDETTDAQGNDTQNYRDYYDANCAQPERVATLVFPNGTNVGSASGSITGSTTEYARNGGAVSGYATLQISWTSTTVTVVAADAPSVGGAVAGRSGVTCVQTGTGTYQCGTASFQSVAGTTTGLVATINETLSGSGNGSGNVNATLSATTYSGSGLTLVPPASGTGWGLSGGAVLDAITGNGSASFSGSTVTTGNYSFADSTQSISASGSFSNAGPLTVTLTQGGSNVATFTIDADGNGSVTYADATQNAVAGYVIFG